MFIVNAPLAAILTATELKQDVRGAFTAAEQHRVYVTKDGQPIGGLVSMEMMEILEETLADRQLAAIAAERLAAVDAGTDDLLDEKEFFARASSRKAAAPAAPRKTARTKR
jgi:PHD/YefM family antitoxin component YafN of YafNO toxin-antitoxin module